MVLKRKKEPPDKKDSIIDKIKTIGSKLKFQGDFMYLKDTVREMVCEFSKYTLHASWLANYIILEMLENKEDLPNWINSEKFWKQCLRVASGQAPQIHSKCLKNPTQKINEKDNDFKKRLNLHIQEQDLITSSEYIQEFKNKLLKGWSKLNEKMNDLKIQKPTVSLAYPFTYEATAKYTNFKEHICRHYFKKQIRILKKQLEIIINENDIHENNKKEKRKFISRFSNIIFCDINNIGRTSSMVKWLNDNKTNIEPIKQEIKKITNEHIKHINVDYPVTYTNISKYPKDLEILFKVFM